MSLYKMTTISGLTADGAYRSTVVRGHWAPDAAARRARRMKIIGPVEVTWSTADLSGRGRGGYDRVFQVDGAGNAIERPLSAYERACNARGDADDVYDTAD